MKDKIILAIVTGTIALAGIIHAAARYVYFLGCRFMSAPAEIAFLLLIPYALACIICLTVAGIILHVRKKRRLTSGVDSDKMEQ